MLTLQTLETRWFFPGTIPQEVQIWFSSLGEPETQPPRTDLYLLGVAEDLGVKLREGRMEAKQRTSQYGETNFGGGVCGLVEGWVKWSFEAEENPLAALHADPHWAAVEKTRQIIYYRWVGDGRIEPSTYDSEPEIGGGLELTALRLAGQDWWTIGVEVFGAAQVLPDFLAGIVALLQGKTAITSFTCQNSYSYPYLLKSMDWEHRP